MRVLSATHEASSAHERRILAGSSAAGRRQLEKLPEELDRLATDIGGNGAYGGTRFYSLTAKAIRDHYRLACEAACGTIVRLAGPSSNRYADSVDQVLSAMALDAFVEFPISGVGLLSRRGDPWLSREAADLQAILQADRAGHIADLRLGLSERVTMTKPTVSIDNRGGAAAIMMGDGNSQKIEGGLKAGVGIDVAELLRVLATIRETVARTPLALEHREEIEDAIVSTEREAQQDQPNHGRVKRLLNAIARTAKEHGVPIAETVLEAYLKNLVT